MTGAQINIRLDDKQVLAGLKQLQKLGADMQPLLHAIGVGLLHNTRQRFAAETAPDGSRWARLNPLYAAIKQGPGILRGPSNQAGLLGSLTMEATAQELTIGSNKVYAAIHQFGGTIKPKKTGDRLVFRMAGGVVFAKQVTIPARPYLGISETDRETIAEVVEAFVANALAGRPPRLGQRIATFLSGLLGGKRSG